MKMPFAVIVLSFCLPWNVCWAKDRSPDAPACVTADEALKRLQEGNARFVSGKVQHPHADIARLKDTSTNGQHPFAVLISCSDSRVPPEILFDQGVGDLFVVRVAGNVVDAHEIGSVEYALEHLGAQLVVMLGHTDCGAVTAATSGGEVHGSIGSIIESIRPAVAQAQQTHPDLHGKDLIPATIEANVWNSTGRLAQLSPVARELAKDGKLKVVGAVYNLGSGKVAWLGESPVADGKASAVQPNDSRSQPQKQIRRRRVLRNQGPRT